MRPVEALDIWAQACSQTSITWYLYRETLLCANGYHMFPAELPYAQIVVFSKDLSRILEDVFPRLPSNWALAKQSFVTNKCLFSFESENNTVLSIDILHAVENQAQLDILTTNIVQLRSRTSKKLNHLDRLTTYLGNKLSTPFSQISKKTIQKTYNSLFSIACISQKNLLFYCDSFTCKKGVLFDREWFADTQMLICGEKSYPVFSGYHNYLANQYGDYENGLFDDIGCGLTVEEKVDLKEHQLRCREALEFVQQLSLEHGLQYYLLAGSVLGAIRHGGFVPWDDDIDIGIRIENLARFENLVKTHLPSQLPSGFTLEQSGAYNPYPRMFSKICYEGRCCIDLWPLIPTYEAGIRAKFTWYTGKLLTKVHYKKIGHPFSRHHKLVNLVSSFMSDGMTIRLARYNERKYMNRQTPAYINLYSIYKRNKETIKRAWIDEVVTASFCGIEVPIIGATNLYLTHLYGDYMSKPVPWNRASRHVARFNSK